MKAMSWYVWILTFFAVYSYLHWNECEINCDPDPQEIHDESTR